jgi:hypothetical protein
MGTGSFPGVNSGRGVTLTSHALLVPWSRKSTAEPLLTPWAVRPVQSLSACTRVHFTFTSLNRPVYHTLPSEISKQRILFAEPLTTHKNTQTAEYFCVVSHSVAEQMYCFLVSNSSGDVDITSGIKQNFLK